MRLIGRWTEGHGRRYINSTASPYGSTCSTHQVKAILLFYLPHLFDPLCREPLLLHSHRLSSSIRFTESPFYCLRIIPPILIPLIPENQPCIPPNTYHTSSPLASVVPSSWMDPHT
ncbi:hypothetical protein EJ02DRAFT_245192 [Clathrospora elynae]|uniref:Uncharacterized protein n=1 Tax=Clathrospora elynae TaxID=706981 RepID=A0A6A5SMJ7_9PLEO|nr:hypothetical protein EJ02DRAFT_245192 [Clathrospora elynae]